MSALPDESRVETGDGHAGAAPAEPAVVIAVDLGCTHLRGAAVDENGGIHHRFKLATPPEADSWKLVRASRGEMSCKLFRKL